ncbi:hypothetical protein L7F22_009139 [Adiantum nelumboides]|nr:hypothetical protein [Adiantum nelumboides]
MVFAVLTPIHGGPLDKRKHAAFDMLMSRSSTNNGGEISKRDVSQYMKTLTAAYLCSLKEQIDLVEITREEGDRTSISYPEFVELFDDIEWGFGILNILARLETAKNRVRHGRQTCSVYSYYDQFSLQITSDPYAFNDMTDAMLLPPPLPPPPADNPPNYNYN